MSPEKKLKATGENSRSPQLAKTGINVLGVTELLEDWDEA